MNTPYCDDYLKILRDSIKDGSVDLIYPDQPFNSNCNKKVFFEVGNGHQAD